MWYLYKYTENIESVVKYFSVAFIRTYIHLQPQQKSSQGDEERRQKYQSLCVQQTGWWQKQKGL